MASGSQGIGDRLPARKTQVKERDFLRPAIEIFKGKLVRIQQSGSQTIVMRRLLAIFERYMMGIWGPDAPKPNPHKAALIDAIKQTKGKDPQAAAILIRFIEHSVRKEEHMNEVIKYSYLTFSTLTPDEFSQLGIEVRKTILHSCDWPEFDSIKELALRLGFTRTLIASPEKPRSISPDPFPATPIYEKWAKS